MRLGENTAKLEADFFKGFISSDVIEFEALPNLSIACRAEVHWAPVGLLEMVDTHHEALVKCAVAQAKHVAEFVRRQLHNSHQSLTLELGLGVVFLLSPFWHESMNTMDSTIAVSITEAEIT